MTNRRPTLFDMLQHTEHDEDWLKELFDMGCKYEDWKETAITYRDKSPKLSKGWEAGNTIKAEPYPRDIALTCNSPLEALSTYIRYLESYPPPEVLLIIANQFKYYMENAGDITLEEAFFGSVKGKGSYAYRCHNENPLYELFHNKLKLEETLETIGKNTHGSQQELLNNLLETPMYSMEDGIKKQISIFYSENQNGDFDSESFLRGYRRWRNNIQD